MAEVDKKWKDVKPGDELYIIELYDISSNINYVHKAQITHVNHSNKLMEILYTSDKDDHEASAFIWKQYLDIPANESIFTSNREFHLTRKSVRESFNEHRYEYQQHIDRLNKKELNFNKRYMTLLN